MNQQLPFTSNDNRKGNTSSCLGEENAVLFFIQTASGRRQADKANDVSHKVGASGQSSFRSCCLRTERWLIETAAGRSTRIPCTGWLVSVVFLHTNRNILPPGVRLCHSHVVPPALWMQRSLLLSCLPLSPWIYVLVAGSSYKGSAGGMVTLQMNRVS